VLLEGLEESLDPTGVVDSLRCGPGGWMLPSGLSKRQRKRARDQERWRQASREGGGGVGSTDFAIEYGLCQSGHCRRNGRYATSLRRFWGLWKRFGRSDAEGLEIAGRHRLVRLLRAWFVYVRSGGFAKAEIIDEEEGIFRAMDPTPGERRQERESLQEFLLKGQKEWSKDGGVNVPPKKEDPRLTELWPYIWKARKRRPTRVISVKEDVSDFVGTFWSLEDFEGVNSEVRRVLEETSVEERKQVEFFREKGTFSGDQINIEGCRRLGLSEEKISELSDGVSFEFDDDLPAYSKTPYSTIYEDLEITLKAAREVIRLLKLGKLLPLKYLAWIESRITAVIKVAPLEHLGFKWRTCVDLTASGVNGSVRGWKFSLPTVESVIAELGRHYFIVKQDIADMFLNFKIHPSRWVLFGFQHPITGQTYVYPCLPFGFSLSPPICCANSQMVADIIAKEARARALGQEGHEALREVPRRADWGKPEDGPLPASSVYVDDFMGSVRSKECTEELADIGSAVFDLIGSPEKVLKREGPSWIMAILGFVFCTVMGILTIPELKAEEMLVLIDSALERAYSEQSVSWAELARIVGKLTWACTGVELGRLYLRNLRKPLIAVQKLLKFRVMKESFCIPLWHFGKAVAELEWWREALRCSGGRYNWFLNAEGRYAKWMWTEARGGPLPIGVIDFATDASKWGGGGVFEDDRVVLEWNRDEVRHQINILECAMVLHMCMVFGARWRGLRVVGWCDIDVSVRAINKGTGTSEVMSGLIRRIRLECIKHGFVLWMRHIPGVENLDPDALSQGALARRVGSWSFVTDSMAKWAKRRGPFTVDCYADVNGGNSKAPRWFSQQARPKPDELEEENVWAFPPPSLAEQFWDEWRSWGKVGRVTAVLPVWACGELPDGWLRVKAYLSSARVLQRRVGKHWVRCECGGVPLVVVTFN